MGRGGCLIFLGFIFAASPRNNPSKDAETHSKIGFSVSCEIKVWVKRFHFLGGDGDGETLRR